jgi:hypothetical protein
MARGGQGGAGKPPVLATASGLVSLVASLMLCSLAARAGGGLVALQTAAPSCPDDSANVYVDCGNGTVTDNRTGLVWLKDGSCFGPMEWEQAQLTAVNLSDLEDQVDQALACGGGSCDCNLSDGSSPGDWRLPTFAEWQVMVEAAVALGCTYASSPAITADNGLGCWNELDHLCAAAGTSCSFTGVEAAGYWTATVDVDDPLNAWDMSLVNGLVFLSPKSTMNYAWPVRGGQ